MSGIFNSAIFNNAIFNTGAVVKQSFSGGWENWKYARKAKTKEEIEEERIRLGITEPVAKVIDNVVEGLLSNTEQDRKDELKYQLSLNAINYEKNHLKALNHQYNILLNAELEYRLLKIQEDEDISILLLII